MVIKGTKRNRPKPTQEPERPSPTRCIDKVAALKRQPLKEEALDLLHELAKLVAPIMEKHGFRVGLFCEMYPKSANLLGLNVNGGQKIMIRLRTPHNNLQFISKSELVGTVLHELTHNKYGPHNNLFYTFLDKLTTEFESMMSRNSFNLYGEVNFNNMFGNNSMLNKQITSKDAFSSPGHRLGASSPTFKEVNKLGGARQKGKMRDLILLATERRIKDDAKCHGGSSSQLLEDEYFQEMQSQGEIPLNDDLDIVIIKETKRQRREPARTLSQTPAKKRDPPLQLPASPIEVIELSD